MVRGVPAVLLLAAGLGQPTGVVGPERRIWMLEDAGGRSVPREIGAIAGAVRISVSPAGRNVLVNTEAGEVWAWGDNLYGQLGAGDRAPRSGWVRVAGVERAVAVAAGGQHGMALDEEGAVWTWGANAEGQLGDGTMVDRLRPARVAGMPPAAAIAAGPLSSAVRAADGSVWVFGSNWENLAAREPRRILARPVRVEGLSLDGEIEVHGGKVVGKKAGVARFLGRLGEERVARFGGRAIEVDGGAEARFERTVSVLDCAGGWALGWIEENRLTAGAERELGSLVVRGQQRTLQGVGNGLAAKQTTVVRAAGMGAGSVAAGKWHALGLRPDGTVRAWGANSAGQLGNGTAGRPSSAPVVVKGLSGVVTVTAGWTHSLAVTGDGSVWAWGDNGGGNLGDTTTTNRAQPVKVSSLSAVVSVAAGGYHSLAAKNDGTVWAWGWNANGQLGNGTMTQSAAPVQVAGLTGVIAVAAGGFHSLALSKDGTVWAWGWNGDGELGDATTTSRPAPARVNGLTGVAAVAAGALQSFAVKTDGTVWAWGWNGYGQLGDGTTSLRTAPVQVKGLTDAVSVAAGLNHAFAQKSDGTVWAWGANFFGQLGDGTTVQRLTPVQAAGLTGTAAIAAGFSFSAAMRHEGAVWSWGRSDGGQLGDGTTAQRLVPVQVAGVGGASAIAAVQSYNLAVKSDGTVWAWGWNPNSSFGHWDGQDINAPVQKSGLTEVIAVAAGYSHRLALKRDGTVWGWGANTEDQLGVEGVPSTDAPIQVSSLTGVAGVASKYVHSLARKNDGTVWAWGANNHGQLGDGTTARRQTPFQVSGLTGAVSVAAGIYHSLAAKGDGTVWAWGEGRVGQLGQGKYESSLAPVQVAGLGGVTAVAAGGFHSLALKKDGTVWAWGRGQWGQLGDGAWGQRVTPVQVVGLTGVLALAGGSDHSLALKSDGTVWAWGRNEVGQLGDGTTTDRSRPVQVAGLSDVVAVAAAEGHSIALKRDGTVWAWGDRSLGQTGDGSNFRATPTTVAAPSPAPVYEVAPTTPWPGPSSLEQYSLSHIRALEDYVLRTAGEGAEYEGYYGYLCPWLDAVINGAQADPNPTYAEHLTELIDRMISNAAPDKSGLWIETSGVPPQQRELDAVAIASTFARAAALLLSNDDWKARYGAKAQNYIRFIETNVLTRYDGKTYANRFPDGVAGMWDVRASHYGVLMAALYQATGSSAYKGAAVEIGNAFRAKLRNHESGWIWDEGQIPTAGYHISRLSYWGNHEGSPDTSFAGFAVRMMVHLHEAGLVFARSDLQRMANTLTDKIWNGDSEEPLFSNYINGSNKAFRVNYGPWSNGVVSIGWCLLSRYSQRALDALHRFSRRVTSAHQDRNPSVVASGRTGALQLSVFTGVLRWKLSLIPPPPVKPAALQALVAANLKAKPENLNWYAPGEVVTLFGADLCGTVTAAPPGAAAVPWPLERARCRVVVDGTPVPIQIAFTLTSGSSQINAQLPFGLTAGTHSLQVQRIKEDGSVETASSSLSIAVKNVSLTLFGNEVYPAFIQNLTQGPAGNVFVGPQAPAGAGDVLMLYGTGLGETTPKLQAGQAAGTTITHANQPVKAWLRWPQGGEQQFWEVTVLYAVASPQFPGLYQIALRMPEDFPKVGAKALLIFQIGGEWFGNSENAAYQYPVYLK